jgi:hypothetical protein
VVAAGSVPSGSPIETGPLPAGSGYTFILRATDVADAGVTCGAVVGPLTLMANYTLRVAGTLMCSSPNATGDGCGCPAPKPPCGTWQTIAVTPTDGTIVVGGEPGLVVATGSGPDVSALRFDWSVTDSSVAHVASAASATSTTSAAAIVCDAPGDTSIQVNVSDGPLPDGDVCPMNLSEGRIAIHCVAVAADAGVPAVDASPVDDAPAVDDAPTTAPLDASIDQ